MKQKNEVFVEPHPILRQKASEIKLEDIPKQGTQALIKKMARILMRMENGVGLAAPQVGAPLRLFISLKKEAILRKEEERKEKIKKEDRDPVQDILIFINPKITKTSKKKVMLDEGCLSVPDIYGHTKRYEKVTIRAQDEKGNVFQRGTSGLLAQIVQHEVDHLNGILFIDHAVNVRVFDHEQNYKKHSSSYDK